MTFSLYLYTKNKIDISISRFYSVVLIYSVVLFLITEYKILNIDIEDQESRLLKPLQKTSQMLMPNITKHKEVIFEKLKEETKD